MNVTHLLQKNDAPRNGDCTSMPMIVNWQQSAPVIDVRALSAKGVAALSSGDPALARRLFAEALRADRRDADLHFVHAVACFRLADLTAAEAALGEALKINPRHLRALLARSELAQATGDVRAAAAFALAATRVAAEWDEIPKDIEPQIARAKALCAEQSQVLESEVRQRLATSLGAQVLATPRVAECLDILFGHQPPYESAPRYLHYPGLASIPFHDRGLFPWLAALEAKTAAMRAEFEALADRATFAPYLATATDRPRPDHLPLLDDPRWSACYLVKNGIRDDALAACCPETMAAFAGVPLAAIDSRSPSLFFSRLLPGTHIPPHNGLTNVRLVGHLPLVVPAGCRFRVGRITRQWQEGQAWLFDDTIEHEAWNEGDMARTILIFEVWRPELASEEIEAVRAIFAAIDAASGAPPAWEI
jgi:aspartyl/asparaginyl beta-hydroxylase (cupin superfamily)